MRTMKKFALTFLSLLLLTPLVCGGRNNRATRSSLNRNKTEIRAGNHKGEVKQLDVKITFSGSYGETVTDEYGTTFNVWGFQIFEDKVYPSEYWGVFPLYFFGTEVGITVKVTNNGPRAIANLRVRTEVYCLRTDGSNGAELTPSRDIDFSLETGECKVINASFVGEFVEGAESGLDRLLVKLLHPNEGGGPGNQDPALIMVKEAIFCPPENEGEVLDILDILDRIGD